MPDLRPGGCASFPALLFRALPQDRPRPLAHRGLSRAVRGGTGSGRAGATGAGGRILEFDPDTLQHTWIKYLGSFRPKRHCAGSCWALGRVPPWPPVGPRPKSVRPARKGQDRGRSRSGKVCVDGHRNIVRLLRRGEFSAPTKAMRGSRKGRLVLTFVSVFCWHGFFCRALRALPLPSRSVSPLPPPPPH